MIAFNGTLETNKGDFPSSKYCINLCEKSDNKFVPKHVEIQIGRLASESFINSNVIANYQFDSKLLFEEIQAEVIVKLSADFPNNTFSKL